MAVLVSGGAGYVGSHTVRLLASRGHEVVVLDDLSTGRRAAVAGVPLVVGDVADGALVREVVADRGVDAAIHFAAVKSVEGSVRDPIGYFEKNVVGSIRLLRALADEGVHQ